MTQQETAAARSDAPQAEEAARAATEALREILGHRYPEVERAAAEMGFTVTGWVRNTLLAAAGEQRPITRKTPAEIERALDEATAHSFPTGDIEDILRETAEGRWKR